MAGDPLRRHQCGHRDRQDGDLGHETGARGQVVEHLPQGELGQAAGDEEEAGEWLGVVVSTVLNGVGAPSPKLSQGRAFLVNQFDDQVSLARSILRWFATSSAGPIHPVEYRVEDVLYLHAASAASRATSANLPSSG